MKKIPPWVLALLALTAIAVFMGAVVTYRAGTLQVSVREKKRNGDFVYVVVPAIVIPPILKIIPADELKRHVGDLRPWLPAIGIACRELERAPDFLLVEVIDSDDHVRITKRSGALIVDVDSGEAEVHIQVPLGVVRSVAERLDPNPLPV